MEHLLKYYDDICSTYIFSRNIANDVNELEKMVLFILKMNHL